MHTCITFIAIFSLPTLHDPDSILYQQLVGSLLYLTITHPNISCIVHQMNQFIFAPHSTYYVVVLRIVQRLKGTFFQSLHISTLFPLVLQAYSDANWWWFKRHRWGLSINGLRGKDLHKPWLAGMGLTVLDV